MQGDTQHPYSYDHDVADDGTVTFQCSTDAEKWPWLALHPFDPIVVQSINFWASVETATARGTWNPEKWSALAHMTWQCGEQGVGHAIRGVGKQTGRDGSPGFHIIFFDANDALVFEVGSKGVIFQTRDFEAWRAKARVITGSGVWKNLKYGACLAEIVFVWKSKVARGARHTWQKIL